MDLELRHLRLILAVAQEGSITRAAATLGLNQPGVSAQLTRLEKRLGSDLFIRSRRGATPTPMGSVVIEYARRVETQLCELQSAIKHARAAGAPLRVAANYSSQFAGLLQFLVDVGHTREVTPFVNLSTSAVTRELVDGTIDLAIVGVHPGFDDAPPPGIEQMTVVEREPMYVTLSKRHPLADQIEVAFAAVAHESWLLPPGEPDGTDAALVAMFADLNTIPVAPYGRQEIIDFWPYIGAGKLVALTLPTMLPPPGSGATIVGLTGVPLYGRQVLRWRSGALDASEATVFALAARSAFAQQLEQAPELQTFWEAAPDQRPII